VNYPTTPHTPTIPAARHAVALDGDRADEVQRSRELISAFKVPTRIECWSESDVPWLGSGKPDKLAIKARLEKRV
jgi:hypothetical protein